jgi:hypothetical protein
MFLARSDLPEPNDKAMHHPTTAKQNPECRREQRKMAYECHVSADQTLNGDQGRKQER